MEEKSKLTQTLIHRAWKKCMAQQTEKARMLLPKTEVKISFWKQWRLNRKGFSASHYRIGMKRLVMV